MPNPQLYNIGTDNWSTQAADALAAAKQEHGVYWSQGSTGTIVAATYYNGPIRAAATLISFECGITETIATGADRTVTVDLKRSTGGGAFATVLSGTVGFTNGSTLLATSVGSITSTALVDGDFLQVTVAVAGAAGNQALGFSFRVFWREAYQ